MSNDRLRKLMQEVYEDHIDFHKEIEDGHRWHAKGVERSEVAAARNQFRSKFNLLFSAQLHPLRAAFLYDAESSVNDVIDFLEIDLPVFRCGYEKEWYLAKLKSVLLTSEQRSRLKSAALKLLSNGHYRRELHDWGRLMIVLADEAFVAKLQELSDSDEHYVQQNSRRMLKIILGNRTDLSGKA